MSGRLLVRERLNLVVVVPLAAVLLTAVPLAAGQVDAARGSAEVSAVVTRATLTASLVAELQRERQLSLLFLGVPGADRGELLGQQQRVAEAAAALAGPGGRVAALKGLAAVREAVANRTVRPAAALAAYGEATGTLLGDLGAARQVLAGAPNGSQVAALLSLLEADEQTAVAGATLLALAVAGDPQADGITGYLTARALGRRLLDQFRQGSRPEEARLVDAVLAGPVEARVDSAARSLQAPGRTGRLAGDTSGRLARLWTAVDLQAGARRTLEERVAAGVAATVTARERAARVAAGLVIGGSVVLFLVVALLSVAVGRSIVQPLRRLSSAARAVSEVARQELLRVADDEDDDEEPPRLAAVDIGTEDELGELATAINQVQATAALLLDRQIAGRRNVATMFGNIGRRTQNLVGRQLAMIDQLERDEQDAAVLERLYRLDHVSVRLRRSANSLLVLSGGGDKAMSTEPLAILDVLRAALQEIEGFQRVRIGVVDEAMLVPHAVPDLILLLAELLENGTSFSPPNKTVEVTATARDDDGVLVRIVDHGIGLTDEQLAAENERLIRRERLDLAPTDVLGLFVVGRLARRHGIRVALLHSPGTGVTAEVRLPMSMMVARHRPWVPTVDILPAAPLPASARDWWEPARPSTSPPGLPGPGQVRAALGAVQASRASGDAGSGVNGRAVGARAGNVLSSRDLPPPPAALEPPPAPHLRPSPPPPSRAELYPIPEPRRGVDLPALSRRVPGAQHPP
ncbi:MAG TPA: nitrate- and nitrite sensing domain-containing protein, partial [Mycobacteriales bacterium]